MLYNGYKQTFIVLKIHAEMVKKQYFFRQNVQFWPFLENATSGVQNIV